MKKVFIFVGINIFCAFSIHAQSSYDKAMQKYVQEYKKAFLTEKNSPISASDTQYIFYFAPNKNYRVAAQVLETPDSPIFDMATASGKTKQFRQLATLTFELLEKQYSLKIFVQIKNGVADSFLFLPFRDETNSVSTYGGGRYLEFKQNAIQNGYLWIDFNKAFNPYCAYKEGYSCPLTPQENTLPIKVTVGEKMYGKNVEE